MATKSNYSGEPFSERSSSMTDDLSNRASEAKQKVSDMARNAADAIDVRRMMSDVESVVSKNPGPSLLIAAAFGFLVGRALTRD